MATELTRLSAFLARIRQTTPSAVVLKFNDRRTPGIPDVFLARAGRAMWIEAKHLDAGERVEDALSPSQVVTLRSLVREQVRCCVLVFVKRGGISIYEPEDLVNPVLFGVSVDEATHFLLYPHDVFFKAEGRA